MRHPVLRPLSLCAGLCLAGATFAQQPPAPPAVAPGAVPVAVPGAAGMPAAPGVAGMAGTRAGRPLPPPPEALAQGTAPTVSGRFQRWLTNPGGRVDGFLLADGTQVQFPPHLADAVQQAVRPGDTVQVTGWRAPNAPVLRAVRLTAGGRTVEDLPPSAGNPPPPAYAEPSALVAMQSSGRVARLLYTPRGDANGVLLDNGAIVRFPPHVGTAMAASLQPGSVLFARGWGSRGPQGDALEATALGPSPEAARELFAGPGVEPPLPGPRGAHPHRKHHGPARAVAADGAPLPPPPPQAGVPAAPAS